MEKIAIRGVIQFFFLEGITARDIHESTFSTLEHARSSYAATGLWINDSSAEKQPLKTQHIRVVQKVPSNSLYVLTDE